MSKRITNAQAMDKFRVIAEHSTTCPNDTGEIVRMQNELVNELTFLVKYNTRMYKSMSNYEDLNQEGLIGLIRAVRIFDHTRFPNFFVFANQWILNGIKRAAKKYDIVYSPSKKRVVYKTDDEIEKLLVDEKSLDDVLDESRIRTAVRSAVSSLPKRDGMIISKLFGLDNDDCTLRDTEKFCNVSYERIRQIKNKALERLRSNSAIINITK
jgi:RNA polymerase sigma factor (sigma-70 family)